jgi:hypothetical protein
MAGVYQMKLQAFSLPLQKPANLVADRILEGVSRPVNKDQKFLEMRKKGAATTMNSRSDDKKRHSQSDKIRRSDLVGDR